MQDIISHITFLNCDRCLCLVKRKLGHTHDTHKHVRPYSLPYTNEEPVN